MVEQRKHDSAACHRCVGHGDLAYISYNAMPGRAIDLPLQRLVRELGSTLPGDSMSRLTAGATIVHRLANLKPPALAASSFLHRLRKNKQRLASPYLVHELMIGSWAALWVTQVRAEMMAIGLAPIESATLIQNFDSLVLGRAARKALATISNDNRRRGTCCCQKPVGSAGRIRLRYVR
jgi:hypothetical protein